MTRTEAEALLPPNTVVDMSFGSSGNHRDFYAIGERWRVAIIYRAPWETNFYHLARSVDGTEMWNGPHSGWTYRPTPDQKVIAGPVIERVRSRAKRFVDPLGGFTASIPKREPNGVVQTNQPTRPATNSMPSGKTPSAPIPQSPFSRLIDYEPVPSDFPTYGTPGKNSIRVTVLGYAIKRPGYYHLPKGTTVHDAIEAAQGLVRFVWWGRPYSGILRKQPSGHREMIWFTRGNQEQEERLALRNDDVLRISHEVY